MTAQLHAQIPVQEHAEDVGALAAVTGALPALPPNLRFVLHVNECYDWGTLGWLLASRQVAC